MQHAFILPTMLTGYKIHIVHTTAKQKSMCNQYCVGESIFVTHGVLNPAENNENAL